jgi:hypothetical protein
MTATGKRILSLLAVALLPGIAAGIALSVRRRQDAQTEERLP